MFNKKLLNYFIIILLFGFFVLFLNINILHAQLCTELGCRPVCGKEGTYKGHDLTGYRCVNPNSDEVVANSCLSGSQYTDIEAEKCPGQCNPFTPECTKCCKLKPTAGAGDYTLNDFMNKVVGLARWILGITGSLALLFFIYGGVMFLISGGNSERVTKAKQIIIGAVIGLIIVFTAYMIIGFVMKTMGATSITGWATSDWFQ